MGSIALPIAGSVYVDTPIVIYTVQQHPVYAPLCRPLWQAAEAGSLTVVSSDLTVLETLVVPVRTGDVALQRDFEAVLFYSELSLRPITHEVLREAARLRALLPSLRTPDAIHTATATLHGCALFLTNDTSLKRIPGLSITLLDDLVG